VVVWKANTGGGASSTYDPSDGPQSAGAFLDWRAYSRSFESLATVVIWKHELSPEFDLIATDRADRLRGAFATPNFFTLVGVQASLGRVFTESDSFQSQEAVISDGLWRRAFGADSNVIGRTIRLILLRSSDASYPSLRTQTANVGVAPALPLVEVPLALKSLLADPVRFITISLRAHRGWIAAGRRRAWRTCST
jgi:hypothetical protein